MTAPAASPNARAMIHVYGWLNPRPSALGSHSAWIMAMNMPVKPRVDPIERSMLRDTMTSTMPVAMIATAALCTERFQRLRGVRNRPLDTRLKTTQIARVARIRPRRRVSTSRAWSIAIGDRRGGSCVTVVEPWMASLISAPR